MRRPADELLVAHRRTLLWTALGLAVASLGILALAKTTRLVPDGNGLHPWTVRPSLPTPLRQVVDVFVWLGRPGVAAATVALLALLVAADAGPRRAALVLAVAPAGVVVSAAKDLGRHTSAPSGHAAYAAAVFGAAAWFAFRRGSRGLALACLVLAVAMGPLRVIEGAHRPVDVVIGAGLGVAWLLAVLAVGTPLTGYHSER